MPISVPFPDEHPTRKAHAQNAKALAFARRVERLADLALEKLIIRPDPDSICSAIEDLGAILKLAKEVQS